MQTLDYLQKVLAKLPLKLLLKRMEMFWQALDTMNLV